MENEAWRHAFCPLEFGVRQASDCLFHFFPVPLERTVSYGGGASGGPDAILLAAEELEPVYLGTQPGEAGGFVHPPIDCDPDAPVEIALKQLADQTEVAVRDGRVPVTLGGEHTVTLGSATGLKQAGLDFGIVQIDAHADLRDSYGGTPYSHGCVMRRIHERFAPPILQIGVRGLCLEDIRYRRDHGIAHIDGPDLHRHGLPSPLIPDDFPESIYLTFDIDGLDASLMPATGTPSPGGLFWHQVEEILAAIVESGRRIVGFDVVELAPIPGLHSADFVSAVSVYACMHAVLASRGELDRYTV